MLGTVAKAGRVLELFTPDHAEWGVTELANELALPKSNAHDLLSSLVSINLLQRTKAGRYRLGWRIVSMANSLTGASELRRHAQRILPELARVTGQTTHLAVWDGERHVFLGRAITENSLDQAHALPGCFLPAYCTASGKLLLSELPWSEIEKRVAKHGFLKRTPHTVCSLGELDDQLQETSSRGYGINTEEADPGVCAMAVPVRDKDGQAIAALGVSMTRDRFDMFLATHMPTVLRTAARLSAAVNTSNDASTAPTSPVPLQRVS